MRRGRIRLLAMLAGAGPLLGAAWGQDAPSPAPAPAPAPAPVPAPAPAPAQGAAPAPPSAATATEPQRIEIRGQADDDTAQRRREPVARSIVGREELDKYNDPSIADVLKRQPGVTLGGGSPRLRGLGAGYTQILVNGEPAPPGFSLENLPPSQVERIEITKGATAEHSAQAVAGTINIVLRAVPRQQQRELAVRLGYTRERVRPGFNALWADRFGVLSVSVPVSGYQWRGRNDNDTERLTRDPAGGLLRASIDGLDHWWGGGANIGPRLSWRIDDRLTLEWQNYLQRNEFHSGGRYLTTVDETVGNGSRNLLSTDDRYGNEGYWQTGRTGLSLVRRSADGARLEARIGAQATANRWATHVDGFRANGTQGLVRDVTYEARDQSRTTSGKFTQPWREDHTLAAGWDLERKWRTEQRTAIDNGVSQIVGFEARPFDADVRRSAAFVQDEWQIDPRWSTYFGVRTETIATRSVDQGTAVEARSTVVTPVLHLQHRFDAQGRDLLRGSLTRSYKAPELAALMARPTINGNYPVSGSNPELSPDRVGNPKLQPELATGLDLALERYLPRGGVFSAGIFHRSIRGLIRNAVTLETVPWSSVPRWVSRPINLEGATSTGIELELKGRADELWAEGPLPGAMNLRFSFSAYRSRVAGIPGPDNRLESQQPWTASVGVDHRLSGDWPIGIGASVNLTPAYRTQQTPTHSRWQDRVVLADGYLSWTFSRDLIARLSVNNFPNNTTLTRAETRETGGTLLWDENHRRQPPNWNLGLTMKF